MQKGKTKQGMEVKLFYTNCCTLGSLIEHSFRYFDWTISQDKRMSAADTTLLTRQREMLLQKLDEFERTNKALRRLLREQQATEVCTKCFFYYYYKIACLVMWTYGSILKHLVSDTTSVLVSIPGAKVAFKLKFVGTIILISKKKVQY